MIKVAWGLDQLALNPWRSSTRMFDEPAEMSVPPVGLMHTILRQRKRRFPRVQSERRVWIGRRKLVANGTGREIGNTGQNFELVECGEAVSWFHPKQERPHAHQGIRQQLHLLSCDTVQAQVVLRSMRNQLLFKGYALAGQPLLEL